MELETWIRAHVEPAGPVEVAFRRPWATVLRVPVRGGAVWAKQCAQVQAFEAALTAALARRHPELLPEVLAVDEERARLLLADAGVRLGIGGPPEPWLELLPRYAELQRAETAHVDEHLGAGVPDRRLAAFPALYDAMLARELPPDAAGRARLRAFGPRFRELCAELAAAGIPETSQHDDLHGNNVFRGGRGLRILDWGDSCVSHPFLTLRVTFVHLFLARDDPWRGRLADAYLEPFGRPDGLRAPFEAAQRLAPFAHLFVLLRVLDAGAAGLPDLASTLEECLAAAG